MVLHRPSEPARIIGNYLLTVRHKDPPYHTIPVEHSFSCPNCGEEIDTAVFVKTWIYATEQSHALLCVVLR